MTRYGPSIEVDMQFEYFKMEMASKKIVTGDVVVSLN